MFRHYWILLKTGEYEEKGYQNMCVEHSCCGCRMSGVDANMQPDCGEQC